VSQNLEILAHWDEHRDLSMAFCRSRRRDAGGNHFSRQDIGLGDVSDIVVTNSLRAFSIFGL
jgi:hypothetical protein